MKLLLKFFGYTFLSLFGLLILSFVALQFVSDEQYKEWISKAVSSATNRTFAINGPFNLDIGTRISLSAEDLHFANAPWGEQEDMVAADKVFVELSLLPLLKGILDCTIELDNPNVFLEKDQQGLANWEFGTPDNQPEVVSKNDVKKENESFSLPMKPYIRNFEIKGLAFSYKDGAVANDIIAEVEHLRLYVDGDNIPLTLNAMYQGALPVTLAGTLGSLSGWYGNNTTPIKLEGKIGEVVLKISGTAGPLVPAPVTNLKVSLIADAHSIKRLAEIAGTELPELGNVKLEGHLTSKKKKVSVDPLEATLGENDLVATIRATMEDVVSLTGLKATLDSELQSLTVLDDIVGSELPSTGPWKLKLNATSDALLESSMNITGNIDGEGTKTTVHANIANIISPQDFEADLLVEAGSVADLNTLLGQKLPEQWPLKVTGKAAGQAGQYKVSNLLVRLGEGSVNAELTYTTPSKSKSNRASIIGDIKIKDVDIIPWFAISDAETEKIDEKAEQIPEDNSAKEADQTDQDTGKKEENKVFSNNPLATGPLQDFDIDITLRADNFTLAKDFTIESDIGLTLDQGLLTIAPISLKSDSGGHGDGNIVVDAKNETAKMAILLTVDDFVPPGLNGDLGIDIDLTGQGASMANLMGSLDGHFITSLTGVEIPQSFLTRFGGGLLHQINPLSADSTLLECAIVRFDAEDGMVDFNRKIALQTSEVTWIGAGEINLKTEEIDISVSSKPRKKVSSLTHIGLAEMVHIGGTLAEPSIGLDAAEIAQKYASYSAFVATGGLSFFVQKMFESNIADKNHCERILEEGEKEAEKERKK